LDVLEEMTTWMSGVGGKENFLANNPRRWLVLFVLSFALLLVAIGMAVL
jgi:hypothetical protein